MKIAIAGSYNQPNFGDQLLFDILYKWIKDILPNARILVPYGDMDNIKWPADVKVGGGAKELSSCKMLIFCGGGYLGDSGIIRTKLPYKHISANNIIDRIYNVINVPWFLFGNYFGSNCNMRWEIRNFRRNAKIASIAVKNNMPYCILGVGVGPVSTFWGKYFVRHIIIHAEAISVRDAESAEYVRSLCPKAPLNLSADMVLSMYQRGNMQHCEFKGKKAGIHIGGNIFNFLSLSQIETFIQILDKKFLGVVVFSDSFPTNKNLEYFRERTSIKNIEYKYYNDHMDLLQFYNSIEFVLTTKLHSGIVAYVKGIVPVAFATHLKTRRFYKQIGMNEYCFNIKTDSYEKVLDFIKGLDCERAEKIMALSVSNLAEKAMVNKEILKKFIMKCV